MKSSTTATTTGSSNNNNSNSNFLLMNFADTAAATTKMIQFFFLFSLLLLAFNNSNHHHHHHARTTTSTSTNGVVAAVVEAFVMPHSISSSSSSSTTTFSGASPSSSSSPSSVASMSSRIRDTAGGLGSKRTRTRTRLQHHQIQRRVSSSPSSSSSSSRRGGVLLLRMASVIDDDTMAEAAAFNNDTASSVVVVPASSSSPTTTTTTTITMDDAKEADADDGSSFFFPIVGGSSSSTADAMGRRKNKDDDGITITTATTSTSSKSKNDGLLSKLQEKIGRVDDERIVFPEYETGEVPRLYSSLQYTKQQQQQQEETTTTTSTTTTTTTKAVHRTGSVVGAASLVAGTMVGAGILALPTATAPVGFVPSTVAMGIGWVYMTMSGLLIAELCLNRLGMSGKPGLGMLELYEDALGPQWSKVGSVTYFFLHYTLLVAYIAQGGTNLDALVSNTPLQQLLQVPPQVIFATVCAAGLYTTSPSTIEKANNVFVLVLSAAFIGIITLGAQTADFSSLVDWSNQHPEKVADAFPIIFLSLVFHNIVPTVVNQLEGDRTKITTAIVGGTTVPTLMFLAWNAVVLGNMDLAATGSSSAIEGASAVDPVTLLQTASGNPVLSSLVTTFSSLALVTSLIGFVYGLLDGWTDVFGLPTKGPAYEKWKAPLFGLVFVPPLALSVTSPEIFYHALEIGGAFGVSTLFLVLPPVMVWKQRYGEEQAPLMTKPMVPLGKIPLGSMWKAAATLILEQGADKLGVFDFIKEQLS